MEKQDAAFGTDLAESDTEDNLAIHKESSPGAGNQATTPKCMPFYSTKVTMKDRAPSKGTKSHEHQNAAASNQICYPKVEINLGSLVTANNSTEIKTRLISTRQPTGRNCSKIRENCYADNIQQTRSPKVSFNASSLITSSRSSRTERLDSVSQKSFRPLRTSTHKFHTQTKNWSPTAASNPSRIRFTCDPPSTSVRSDKSNSDASNEGLLTNANLMVESEALMEDKIPQSSISQCSPKVSFNLSGLLLETDQISTFENPESEAPLAVTEVCVDPSSLPGNLTSARSSNDHLAPKIKPSINLNLNQLASSGSGRGVENRGSLRGILRLKQPVSSIDKIITDCLKLLRNTSNHGVNRISTSVSEVFKNLCRDEFFQKGECFSSTCDDSHHYKSHSFSQSSDKVWDASLYVICLSAVPNLRIIENLVQHYTAQKKVIHTLAFATCIPKVKDADRLELAQFIINQLSAIMPARDVIIVLIMLNFFDLSSVKFNAFIEGLGVFEQNTTLYCEIMTFLNSNSYQMPAKFLVRLMKDSIKFSCKEIVETILGFLKRLNPSQKEEVEPTASEFYKCFGVPPATDEDNDEPLRKRSKIQKKKVNFAPHPEIRLFQVGNHPEELEIDESRKDSLDEDHLVDDHKDFHSQSKRRNDIIERTLKNVCITWLLKRQCTDTVCKLRHDFNKDSLTGMTSEEVNVVSDFIIAQSETLSFDILKIFMEFFAESNETSMVLRLKKCARKLSTNSSLGLTRLAISLLADYWGIWEAIEIVLVPHVVELNDIDDCSFLFDKQLLSFIMTQANQTKTSVLKCVARAIVQKLTALPHADNKELLTISSLFMQKFVLSVREPPPFPDILPIRVQPNTFGARFKVALYQGAQGNYFVATIMMKHAVDSLRDVAVDILYTFLLSHFDREKILAQLFDNCKYLDANTRRSVTELIATVGLKTSVRQFENENFAATAGLLNVMEKSKQDVFGLVTQEVTEFILATIYCYVKVDTVDTIELFLSRCLDPLKSATTECPPQLKKLTAKMFREFTSALLVEESLKLYNGIISCQKSLFHPLNIEEFVEPTLRCTFNRACDGGVRKESLKLYLDVIDSEKPVNFHKVTHRSVLLVALMEITHASQKFKVKKYINLLHPLIKKILVTCITEGVYFDLSTPDINIYSSMASKEIEVYVLWWFFIYVRARKNKGYNYFNPITLKIFKDNIRDDSHLPVHHSLQSVNVSVTDCADRLTSVLQNISGHVVKIDCRKPGVFELHPAAVRALSHTASNVMFQHGYISADVDRMCTFCFDKLDFRLAEKL